VRDIGDLKLRANPGLMILGAGRIHPEKTYKEEYKGRGWVPRRPSTLLSRRRQPPSVIV
jgi:hypothetical protein